ncbi:MAG TPA: S9 family peptidase [Thermoanaerobaculia bacterium]|nr:S9 family peptidase [Thermoanaerobaculia bacterium]
MRHLVTLIALLFLTTSATAQKPADDAALVDAVDRVRTFNCVAISPDARHVAWARRKGGVTVADVDGSRPRLMAAGEADYPSWSPDGRSLAWVAGRPASRQLWVARLGGGAPRRVTHVNGYLAEPLWSPDGKSIAFLFIENAGRAAGPLVAMSRAVGVIEEHVAEQRVAVVDVATGKLRIVTPPDMYVYHFDWSPDSARLVAEAAPGSGDNNYWIAQLYVAEVGADAGTDVARPTMRPIYKAEYQLANPRWSPDGRHIAFIEGLMSDEGVTGGDLFLIDSDGTNRRNLTPEVKASVTSFQWTSPDSLLLGENIAGESALVRLTLDGKSELLHRGHSAITAARVIGASVARDGRTTAVIHSGFSHPPEIWAGAIGEWKQITHINAKAPVRWGEAQSIHWRSGDFDVQGWILPPQHVDPARRYPMVVSVHGGPASAATAAYPREMNALLAASGYFVFMPNPRGSYGQGEAFTRANVKDFGHGDLTDVLSGVDAVIASNPIDPDRIGLWGWSYGGYMTMWSVTQTQRFKAAVAGAGVSNWVSYYGENDIDQWMIPYFGASVYDDPKVYAKSSPMEFIRNVKTPTLVLVGERDGECPAPQSFEFWHALKARGVETQLVVYPDEGHAIRTVAHKRDIARRLVGWFDGHLR